MSVRVNGIGTPWCHRDIVEVAAACPRLDRIVLPKSSEPFDIRFVAALLDGIEAARGAGPADRHRRPGRDAEGRRQCRSHRHRASAAGDDDLRPRRLHGGDADAGQHGGRAEPRLCHAGRAASRTATTSGTTRWPASPMPAAPRACGRSTRSMPTTATRPGCGLPPGGRGRWATRGNGRSIRTRWRRSTRSSGRIRRGWTGRGACSRCSDGSSGAVGEGGTMVDAVHARMAREILGQAGLAA